MTTILDSTSTFTMYSRLLDSPTDRIPAAKNTLKFRTSLPFHLAILGLVAAGAVMQSQAETLHYWRFEDSVGYLEDSVGSATLEPLRVDPYAIPPSGPGASFDVGEANTGGVRSLSSPASLVTKSSAPVSDDFTIELFANFDDLSLPAGAGFSRAVLAAQATSAFEPSLFSWAFVVERSGDWQGIGSSQPRELELFISDGDTFELVPSGFLIEDNVDYFLSASFDLDGPVTFYGKNLDSNATLQSEVVHSRRSLNPDTYFQVFSPNRFAFFDGLIDEVRFSRGVLPESELLISGQEPTAAVIGGVGTVGSRVLTGIRSNKVFGEQTGPNVPGLGQSWYSVPFNPGSKEGLDAIFENNDPIVPYFHADTGITWWSGNMDVSDVPAYPSEVDGIIGGDNYAVKLEGEIKIDESGPIRFLDGVDDYTYLAIDLDRSGTAGDAAAEILIDDNSWTNALSVANGGSPIVEVEFENIAEGGEWFAIEFNMAEARGGDHGMLYWDALDEDGFFPSEQGDGVDDIDAFVYMIPNSHLRGPESPPELLSGDVSGATPASPQGWEFDVDPVLGTADTFVLDNPDGEVFTSILDVDGLEIHVNPLGDVSEGASFQVVFADTITGTPTVATEGWRFDLTTGSVVFSPNALQCDPNTRGDIDGNGRVEFADFLILSGNFSEAVDDHTSGDIDCSGIVDFADFLILSGNFGQEVSAIATPEPSGLSLFCSAGLFLSVARRRRS